MPKTIRIPQPLFDKIKALADLNEVGANEFATELLTDKVSSYWRSIQAKVDRGVGRKREPLPGTLLDRVIRVMGHKAMTFGAICNKLEIRGWMPQRRSSVSNVFQKDARMFITQARGTYAVRRSRVK
jgi:hypothetical protein